MYLVLGRALLGVRIVGVQVQNGARQHVHQVARRYGHERIGGEAVGQLALGIYGGHEAVEALLVGQVAHQQQVAQLLEREAPLGTLLAEQVVQLVAAQAQRAFGWHLHPIDDLVAVHL